MQSSSEKDYDLVATGRAGIDLYSLDLGKPIRDAGKFAKYVGGTSANVVVGASRLGLKAALVTRVSDDELGEFIVGFLSKEGVETRYVRKDPRRKTGIVFAEISPGRDGKFLFYRENAADLFIDGSDIPPELVRRSRYLLVTGTGMSVDPSADTNYSAMRAARRHGTVGVFNLDWRPSLWDANEARRVRRYMRVLSISDVVIGNESEYIAATGARDIASALDSIPGKDEKTLIVTRGPRGSMILNRGEEVTVPVFSVNLLKGLGAGDGFIAGFLCGRTRGWSLYQAARFGNAVGGIVVTGHACSESMPTYSQVVEFLKREKADILGTV